MKDNFKEYMKTNERLFRFIFEQVNMPQTHLKTIVNDFDSNDIDYCVVGGIAVGIHNFERFTEDIDLLVSKDGWKKVKKLLIGKGYVTRPGSNKNLYFLPGTGQRIQIDILLEGDKEGKFILPNPKEVRTKIGGIWYLDFNNLLRFKANAGRTEDIRDIEKLIEMNPDKEIPEDIKKYLTNR